MKVWTNVLIGTAAIALTAGTSVAWAQSSLNAPDGESTAAIDPGPAPRALGGGTTESQLVAITPCRIVDTRLDPQGKLVAGGTSTFAVKGTGPRFAQQGGRANGCGIPASATAIEATVTAVDAGSGFLRAWPAYQPAPTATFMNYGPGTNLSNTGLLGVCTEGCIAGFDLNLRAFGGSTHVVIDVGGYYVPPMSAAVNGNGTLARGSRVTTTTRQLAGTYVVTFDRDVRACTYVASVGRNDSSYANGYATAQTSTLNAQSVFVATFDAEGTLTDHPFHLTVTC